MCNKKVMVFLSLLVLGIGTKSSADLVTYTATTIGNPTWARAIANNNGTFGGVSPITTAVQFHIMPFFVDISGNYNFISAAISPPAWDNYLFLYSPTFSVTNQAVGYLIGNDDFPNQGTAGFSSINLTSGNQYHLVTTGFFNSDSGSFSNTISGPGTITLGTISSASEPDSYLLYVPALLSMMCIWGIRKRE